MFEEHETPAEPTLPAGEYTSLKAAESFGTYPEVVKGALFFHGISLDQLVTRDQIDGWIHLFQSRPV